MKRSDSNGLCNWFIWKIRLKRNRNPYCTLLCHWVQQHGYENTWLVLIWQLICYERPLISVQFSFSNIPLLVHVCYYGSHLVVLVCVMRPRRWVEFAVISCRSLLLSPPRKQHVCSGSRRHHGTLMAEEAKKLAAYAAVDNHIQVRLCIYLHCDTLMLLTFV